MEGLMPLYFYNALKICILYVNTQTFKIFNNKNVRVHKKFTKNQHSPLDSANNKCYITARTKEGDKKRAKDKSSMNPQPPEFQETR